MKHFFGEMQKVAYLRRHANEHGRKVNVSSSNKQYPKFTQSLFIQNPKGEIKDIWQEFAPGK